VRKMGGDVVCEVNRFTDLGSRNGGFEDCVRNSIMLYDLSGDKCQVICMTK